jgi:hypothetical protein
MYFKNPIKEDFTVYGVISTKENDYLQKTPCIKSVDGVGSVLEKSDIIYGDINQNFYENGKFVKYIQSSYFDPPLDHLPSTFFSQDIYNPIEVGDIDSETSKGIYQHVKHVVHEKQPLEINNDDVMVENFEEDCKCLKENYIEDEDKDDSIKQPLKEDKRGLEPLKKKVKENFVYTSNPTQEPQNSLNIWPRLGGIIAFLLLIIILKYK